MKHSTKPPRKLPKPYEQAESIRLAMERARSQKARNAVSKMETALAASTKKPLKVKHV
jgi:hypothetical protein